MVGIREIAERAGVSISTVSYALNDNAKVTSETRERIKAIAAELNYTPSLAGRMLKKQKTNMIGLYVNGFGGDFYSHVIDGVANTLRAHHYELIVGSGGSRSRAFVPQRFVDGAIILDVSFPTDLIREYADAGNKLVVMDRDITHPNVARVIVDNAAGARQAIDALAAANVDHFVMVTGPSDSWDSQARAQAAIQEVEKISGKSILVIPGDFTIEGGRKAAEVICNTGDTNIGVFALNDELAIGLYDGFNARGRVVGQDIKIVGFDNDYIDTYLDPKLTSIDYSKHRWGEMAAETVLKMIETDETPADQFLKTKVLHRGSLGEKLTD
ncbi:LacI family DNA-binding transcriptional regulator [Lacticaseibacillus mingshuiensis]|uniref:LacI family DNA-binding transcriptional regulator n=1 Tax=Lacticaseibacillus mingshuiensis TaxID=2799574 RepID=UPI00194E7465|nr:LacI family DNA-binding transcriptional regulator [Lacticaseibacillus mingshuiensis]